jgi:hypothetical protein
MAVRTPIRFATWITPPRVCVIANSTRPEKREDVVECGRECRATRPCRKPVYELQTMRLFSLARFAF